MLRVSGADLLHGTPILDIKPYLPTPTVSLRDDRGNEAGTRRGECRAGSPARTSRRQMEDAA
ncbi:MAG: TrmO family methyltransferase [Bilophila wadsworthia]